MEAGASHQTLRGGCETQEGSAPKRNKVSAACDSCRSKKIKCDGVQPECGPCRTRLNQNVKCSWQHSISRGGIAGPVEVTRLQQRVRDLEQRLNTRPTHDLNRRSQSKVSGQSVLLEAHDGERSQAGPSSMAGALPGRPSSEFSRESVAPSTTAQARRRGSSAIGNSPASAMVGSVDDTAMSHRFFGGSSAGTFMAHIRNVVAQKSGRGNAASPSSMAGASEPSRSPARRNRWTSLSPDDWALPPKSRADALISVYWDIVHPLYPYIDRSILMAQYESLFSSTGSPNVDTSVLCSLNIIFALSCQLDTTISADRRRSSSWTFFQRAQRLLDLWKLEESVESVQALLLLGQYLQSTNEPSQCWLFVGAAIRMAQSLGLHRVHYSVSEPLTFRRRKEVRRRVWHGCIFMDRVLAMAYGRPTMISRSVASATPLPLAVDDDELAQGQDGLTRQGVPTKLDFFVHSLVLHDILEQLLENDPSNSGKGDQATFISIDAKLMAWEAALPAHLKNGHLTADGQQIQRSTREMVLLRQAVVLRQRFLHVRLLTLRPVLSAHIAADINDSSDQRPGTSLSKRIAHQCSIVCIKIAQQVIDLVHTHRASNWATTGLLAAWWYNVLFVYSAATVLLSASLRRISDPELSPESTAESWRRAMNILEGYRDYSESIPRLITTLEVLAAEIPERYSQYAQASLQNIEHRPAATGSSDRRQPILATAHPGHSREEPPFMYIPADYDLGLGAPELPQSNYPDLVFDPGDLSWLNCMPAEIWQS